MKAVGRKTSAAYELYGFIPRVENGKHSAICKSCNRVLQNTAATRLQKHRNSCAASRVTNNDEPVNFQNLETKRRRISNAEQVYQNERSHLNVKTEDNNMQFDDENVNDNVNDDSSFEDTMENVHDYNIPSHKSAPKKDRTDDKLKAKIQYFKEKSKYFLNEMVNLKIEKTLMVLKAKKLRFEIQQLEIDN